MEVTKKYWKGIEELNQTPEFTKHRDNEFPFQNSVEQFLVDEQLAESSTGRRDFLKFLGFSVAAATLAACEAPVTKAVPYVNKPEDVTPGVATWYASTYYDGMSYASILVKTREARPIFIKGNKDFGFTKGGTNPQIIASVLGLYDSERLNGVRSKGEDANISIDKADKAILTALKGAKEIVLLTPTVISPSLNTAISTMAAAYSVNGASKVKVVQYDGVSYGAIRKANELNFGASVIPSYDFSKAKTIVSVGADFLSTWLLGNEYAVQYGVNRLPGKGMSKHYQFESIMSITGSNADGRAQIKPSESANVLAYILKSLGGSTLVSSALSGDAKKVADAAIAALKSSKKESLVVCGSNNEAEQLLTNAINNQLNVYGTTIDLTNDVRLFQSNDKEANQLFDSIIAGKGPDVLINLGANPVYNSSKGDKLRKGLDGLKMYVSTSRYADESSSVSTFIVPDHHQLEGWNDFMPKANHYAVAQPTIRPLGDTYAALESVLVWAGAATRDGKDSTVAFETIKSTASTQGYADFSMLTHNSCGAVNVPVSTFAYKAVSSTATTKGGEWEVVFYQKTGIRDGGLASNPWLQELPDPISKVTWITT